MPSSPAAESAVLVGRRYLERGFLDAAMKVFLRNASSVHAADWKALAEELLGRQRVHDVVHVCEVGGIPLPRERMLEMADRYLARRDVDTALWLFDVAGADQDRWAHMVDALTAQPDRVRQAIDVATRHLRPPPPVADRRSRRLMKAVN